MNLKQYHLSTKIQVNYVNEQKTKQPTNIRGPYVLQHLNIRDHISRTVGGREHEVRNQKGMPGEIFDSRNMIELPVVAERRPTDSTDVGLRNNGSNLFGDNASAIGHGSVVHQ